MPAEIIPITAMTKTEVRITSTERDLSMFAKALGVVLGLAPFPTKDRRAVIGEMTDTGLLTAGERALLLEFYEREATA